MYAECKKVAIDARSMGLYVLFDIWLDSSKSRAVARNDFFWPSMRNEGTRAVRDEDGNYKGTDGNWYAPEDELPEGVEYEQEAFVVDKVAMVRDGLREYWKRRKTREVHANLPEAEVEEYPFNHIDSQAKPQTEQDPHGLLTEDVLALEGTTIEETVVVVVEIPPGSGRFYTLVI